MKNLETFEEFINESYIAINEAVISKMKAEMMGKKLLPKINIDTVFVTDKDEYTVTGYGPKSNAFQEFEVKDKSGADKKVKLTAMYGVKLEVNDDPRSAVYRREESIKEIQL